MSDVCAREDSGARNGDADASEPDGGARKISRRELVLGASASVMSVRAACRAEVPSSATAPERAPRPPGLAQAKAGRELLDLSAVDAVDAMKSGALTAERYAETLLERCARLKALNAFITQEPSLVLEQAREADRRRASGAALGPLHGLPIPVKDSLNTAQYATSGGTPGLRGFRPPADAPLVATLRAAGAIVLGKTNLHELSYGWTSNNLAFGAVHNPYDPTRIPGGSSGGTAVAISTHMAPLGIAEDTEGSIRVPAALCGVMGFRPTTRRYSTVGAIPACSLFDQTGPEARSVADIALFDRVASGDMRAIDALPLKGVRFCVWSGYWFEGLDPEVERITRQAIASLRAAGVEIVEAEVPGLRDLLAHTADSIVDHDVRLELAHYLAVNGANLSFDELIARASPDIRAIFSHEVMLGSPGFVSEATYETAVKVYLPRLRRTFKDYFAKTGAAAILFPTTLVTAPRIGDEGELTVGQRKMSFDVAIGRNIAPGSRTGLPGLVIPTGIAADGLPVSMEFDGPAGTDRTLLGLGLSLERVLGHVRPPPV
jgi:Asp-tRNA(Asn)/Glu-tRNA(Gln) amidotransferase A subunit family amidase